MKQTEVIRKLFLEHREQYSMREAAALVGWSTREMADEIASSELRSVDLNAYVSWRAVAMIAMTTWSFEAIEEALGENASVLPPLARLTERTVRLPRFQLVAIEAAARRQGVTFNEFLAGHLTDLVFIEARHSQKLYGDFAKHSYGRSRSNVNQRTPPNRTVRRAVRAHRLTPTSPPRKRRPS